MAHVKDGRGSASSSISSLDSFRSSAEKGALLDLERGTAGSTVKQSLTLSSRIRQWIDGHYILTKKDPEVVLPQAPSDKDKYGYIQTRRPFFLALGLFAFLSSSAGLWLFALCANYFIWYAPVVFVLQVHIFLSYGLGACAKDFDLKKHNELLQQYPVTGNHTSVDIYLPVCKEPLIVLRNTWKHVRKVQWAHGTLTVHVLDDGAMDEVKAMAEEFGFNYIRRDDRPYFRKAGNLRYAFARTSADFFVIFDADFCPRHDFLNELMPRMQHDPKIAIIQTPQFFKTTKENTWIERGCSEVQELFYRWAQVNRDRWNASICVGSNALYRRQALVEVGGTALVGASEDVHTGFFAITRGWTLRYIPICLAAGISPDTPRAAFSQQIRWSQGSTSLLLNGEFHKARLGFMTKVSFFSGMLYYWTTSISCFTIPLPGLLLVWCRPEVVRYYNLAFAAPSLIYALLVYRIWSVGAHSVATEQIRVLQAYAYLFGIKDRILGKTHEWVSSGAGAKSGKKTNTYARARAFATCWTVLYQSAWISGVAYRLIARDLSWWQVFPQILLYSFDLYVTLPFLLTPAY
ncbi:nucleotide-diphospho-sugar transferase [Microstroma glucosiphilum]|uniref:Nucleotide-diphospho-sugar transferase n=1 Tax=Pseudomicrostroma glucosiphilum TaxID=1684307 RepID=A0A316U0B3_9BASI|nr:nucleotide-diphospho-sugar transferase [Pseudomicrostroma glucosiphilum]PWN18842.1 nucleotide-diphospho-sugar transferase [Pseudomicrostroma glucosiphilum]